MKLITSPRKISFGKNSFLFLRAHLYYYKICNLDSSKLFHLPNVFSFIKSFCLFSCCFWVLRPVSQFWYKILLINMREYQWKLEETFCRNSSIRYPFMQRLVRIRSIRWIRMTQFREPSHKQTGLVLAETTGLLKYCPMLSHSDGNSM